MTQQRQATSSLRLKASLRAIRLEAGPAYEEVLSRSDTVETPVVTTTGPLRAIRIAREQVVQVGTINPAITLSSECQHLLLAGYRTTCIGEHIRLPEGSFEMYDLYFHPQDAWRIMARVRPIEVVS